MKYLRSTLAVAAALFFGLVGADAAQPTKAQKAEHADKNNDGVVDRKEMKMEKEWERERIDAKEKRLSWRHGKAKVNTDIERKYDANGDGWLEPDEVREMLRDKQRIIATDGRAKVDTEIEREYDVNKDGVIDANEAESLREDLKQ